MWYPFGVYSGMMPRFQVQGAATQRALTVFLIALILGSFSLRDNSNRG
jgi:hypothetical protein